MVYDNTRDSNNTRVDFDALARDMLVDLENVVRHTHLCTSK